MCWEVPCPCVGEAPRAAHTLVREQGVAAWLGRQGLALVPEGWPAGDTGSGGVCVVGRGCASLVTEPLGDGRGAEPVRRMHGGSHGRRTAGVQRDESTSKDIC